MGMFSGIGSFLGAAAGNAGLSSVAGPALQYFGAKEQRDSNEEMARAGMNFSAAQSAEQMRFQEEMSSTAHQREVLDLRRAGLNPLLSMNSGASSPPGAQGSAVSIAAPESPMSALGRGISSSATDLIHLMNEFTSSQAQATAARAQASKTGVEEGLLRKKGPEATVGAKTWSFFNALMDRLYNSSAGKAARSFGNAWSGDFDRAVDSGATMYWNLQGNPSRR